VNVAPARAVAFAVLLRVFEDGAWADRALIGEARRHQLDMRDRGLARQLAFGAVQRKATLDHLIERFTKRDPAGLDPPVRAALRLGLYQLAYLERIPAHAAVTESVELVKPKAPRAAGLVNATLRRGARWRKHPDDVARLAHLQREILEAGAAALEPGGTLVYATCTISPPENEDLIAAFLHDHADFHADPAPWSDLPVWDHPSVAGFMQTFPHRDGTDGFFVARLRRVTT